MTDFVFNIAKGKVAYYAMLPLPNDALIAVPILTAGLETINTLRDYDDLASLLAGTTDEQTTMGRKTLANVTVVPDDTADVMNVDFDDVTWTAATGGAISGLIVCYDNDTTSGTDANLVPLLWLDAVLTPNGGDITYQVAAGGAYRAS